MDVHTLSCVHERLPFAERKTEAEECQLVPGGPEQAKEHRKTYGNQSLLCSISWPAAVRSLHSVGPGET